MKLGFIGTGSMGSILIEGLIRSGAVEAADIIASNRTRSKAERLAEKYPGMRIAETNNDAVIGNDIVFICVKPGEYKQVLDDLQKCIDAEQIVVSITSPILIRHLESQLTCKIAKVIPSITNFARSGAALCIYSGTMTPSDQDKLEQLLRHISSPIRIAEEYTRVTSDLSSCGPAFLAFFVQRFVEAAVHMTGIPHDEATRLASEMVLGTGRLLTSGGFTPETLQQRVAVPGGITAEGLRLLADELNNVFYELIRITHSKYNSEVEKAEAAFYGTGVE